MTALVKPNPKPKPKSMDAPFSKGLQRQHLKSFNFMIERNPEQALKYLQKNPWMSSERLPDERGSIFGGQLALHMACAYRRDKLVDFMLQNGANVNARTDVGISAITYALDPLSGINSDPTATINVLLRHGCRVDALDNMGSSFLYQAPEPLPTPLLRKLIEAGAPVDCYDNSGRHALQGMIRNMLDHPVAKTNVMVLLESGVDIEGCQGRGNGDGNALQTALDEGHFDIADRLVELGADVRRINNLGESMLHLSSSPEMIEWLLERAPDLLEKPNNRGRTPVLSLAYNVLRSGDPEMHLRMLIHLVDVGADLDRREYQGDTTASAREMLARNDDPRVQRVWSSLMARQTTAAAMAELGLYQDGAPVIGGIRMKVSP